MRYATVLADSLTVHHVPGGTHIVGYYHRGARLKIVDGPIIRARNWWRVEDGAIGGWAAEGDGKVKWLSVDPVPPMQWPQPDCEPPEFPKIPAMSWMPPAVIAAVGGAVAFISWLFS